MKRTLMLKNQELLDFEIDLVTGDVHILDAPDSGDPTMASLGFAGPCGEAFVAPSIRARCISGFRNDLPQILEAFGVHTVFELVFMGHGASLTDMLWYCKPGSGERWEDVNFQDNGWDPAFCDAVLEGDYSRLAGCSPDVPDLTTGGSQSKAWQKTADGIFLVKKAFLENEVDLEGALLAAELCRLLFGEDSYQPMGIVEHNGARLSASPLMLSRDEELLQGSRLFAMGGFTTEEAEALASPTSPEGFADILTRAGAAEGTAPVAKAFAFKALSLLSDMHAGNYGVIRNVETDARRVAPPFDYDRAFGFPGNGISVDVFCKNPNLAVLMCARSFSDVDPSWDWSWYDPQALIGFEERILGAYAPYKDLPPDFAKLIARFFAIQRNYVNSVSGNTR